MVESGSDSGFYIDSTGFLVCNEESFTCNEKWICSELLISALTKAVDNEIINEDLIMETIPSNMKKENSLHFFTQRKLELIEWNMEQNRFDPSWEKIIQWLKEFILKNFEENEINSFFDET